MDGIYRELRLWQIPSPSIKPLPRDLVYRYGSLYIECHQHCPCLWVSTVVQPSIQDSQRGVNVNSCVMGACFQGLALPSFLLTFRALNTLSRNFFPAFGYQGHDVEGGRRRNHESTPDARPEVFHQVEAL